MKNRAILNNVLSISGATLLGQVFIFITTPLLTRLYLPEDFGQLALFTSVVGVSSLICTLQYDRAINVPKSDEEGFAVFIIAIISSLFFSVLSIFIVTILQIIYFGDIKLNEGILYALGLFSLSCLQAGNFWASRKANFKLVSLAKLIQSILMIIIQILGGILLQSSFMLILGLVLGWLVAGLILFFPYMSFLRVISCENLKHAFFRYKKFPLITLPSMFITSLGRESPVFFISMVFDDRIVGYYALANRLISIPVSLAGKAISQVLMNASSQELKVSNTSKQSLDFVVSLLITAGTLPFILIMLISPKVIPMLLGSEWYETGVMVSILAPFALSFFITSPTTILFSLLERQFLELKINSLMSVLRILGISTVFFINDIYLSLLIYSLFCVIGYFIAFHNVVRVSIGLSDKYRLILLNELTISLVFILAFLILSQKLYFIVTLSIMVGVMIGIVSFRLNKIIKKDL